MNFSVPAETTFIIVQQPAGRLEITPGLYIVWKHLCDMGGFIIWNRDGLVRVVTNKLLREALAVWTDHQLAIVAGRLSITPEDARFIFWEQAEDATND